MEEYLVEFEKLQNMKSELVAHDKSSDYSENETSFIAKNFVLPKNQYINKKHKINELRNELRGLYKQLLSMKHLYIMSRSNAFEWEIKQIFTNIKSRESQLNALLDKKKTAIYVLVKRGNTGVVAAAVDKPNSNDTKRHKVKKFLFTTYNQCVSGKTSEPTYMSKTEIIKHIKEHYPSLLKSLPKRIEAMKKEEICKVIFE